LNWNNVPGATGYRVKRATSSGGIYSTIATNAPATNHVDLTVTNGVTFYYIVTALNAYGESAPSNVASVPVPFPKLTAQAGAANVKLVWSNSASPLKLNSTTNLLPPVSWLPVTNAPLFQSGLWQIVWIPNDAARFFRLATE
jgi:fibronectin type 3 domain-containing protein